MLKSTKAMGRWRYLGLEFSPERAMQIVQDIEELLTRVSRAPLKPQQRMQIIRTYILSMMYHTLVLGKLTSGHLCERDQLIRKHVRTWLRLPKDVPLPNFYAAVEDGGMGVSCQSMIPRLTLARLT